MTYAYFHPEEEFQVWAVENYASNHEVSRYLVEFEDGEAYSGRFATAYDSENGGELGIDMDDPRYDAFHVVTFEIVDVLRDGARRYNNYLSVDYRDFPARITDVSTGTVVNRAESAGDGRAPTG